MKELDWLSTYPPHRVVGPPQWGSFLLLIGLFVLPPELGGFFGGKESSKNSAKKYLLAGIF